MKKKIILGKRRCALLELDVSVEALQTIYRVQFPVMCQCEAETFYDHNGRIVFTGSKGLPGVKFSGAEWDGIKHMTGTNVTHTVLGTTHVERTLTYQTALFTKRNREQDYAMVWAVLDEQKEDSYA